MLILTLDNVACLFTLQMEKTCKGLLIVLYTGALHKRVPNTDFISSSQTISQELELP